MLGLGRREAVLWGAYGAFVVALALGPVSALPTVVQSVVQAVAFAIVLWALYAATPIARVIASLSRPLRIVSVGLALAFVVGHVAQMSRVTFPLVDWRMFGRSSTGPAKLLQFTGIRSDGSAERIIPGGTISDETTSRLDRLVRKLVTEPDAKSKARLEHLIAGIARLDEANTGGRSIVAVQLTECTIELARPRDARCVPLQRISLEAVDRSAR